MKVLALLLLMLGSLSLQAQTFDIPVKFKPFYDIIEWKGMGAILMSKDPSGNNKQINLTLVGNQNTSVWDQKFMPKNEAFYYIAGENVRYVYFLDNLDLDAGKVYFSQINSAGNCKTTNVAIAPAIKSLGAYDPSKLELINVVVTDKALVHHFRYDDKETKRIVEFASFITHHNFLCYAVELGSVAYADQKNPDIGFWDYIGFTEDQIYFAAREVSNKRKGWTIRAFSSKAKPGTSFFVNAPEHLITVENIGFGTTGKYHLKTKTSLEKGLLAQINHQFYLFGGEKKGEGALLTVYQLENNEWKPLNDINLNYFIDKKVLKLGIYPMNEGIGYHLDHNGYDKASIVGFTKEVSSAQNTFTERSIYNPSSVFNRKERTEFSVTLPGRILYFDTKQLGKEGSVTFELIEQ